MVKATEAVASATWDRETTLIFCDLVLKEIIAGNRPTTHFNKEGWLNLMNNFVDRTGRRYDKTQLKNKRDQLKKDWKLWRELKHGAIRLGWDPKRKLIDATDDWWREKLKVLPKARKFRYAGIDPELEEKLDQLFGSVVTTDDLVWTLTHGVQALNKEVQKDQVDMSNDEVDLVRKDVENAAESSQVKLLMNENAYGLNKKKKGSIFLRDLVSQRVSICTSSADSKAVVQPSITDAIKVVEAIEEIYDDVPLYLFVMQTLQDANNRETFMAMAQERRVMYLRHLFQQSQRAS